MLRLPLISPNTTPAGAARRRTLPAILLATSLSMIVTAFAYPASDFAEIIPSNDKSDLSLADFKDSYSQARKNHEVSISGTEHRRLALH
jgi:hypothetical protein